MLVGRGGSACSVIGGFEKGRDVYKRGGKVKGWLGWYRRGICHESTCGGGCCFPNDYCTVVKTQ